MPDARTAGKGLRGSRDVAEGVLMCAAMKKVWRAIVEAGFIIFLFYSNLLMGEFEHSGLGRSKGLVWAIRDIVTLTNFLIALFAALVGHVLFEFFREKL